MVSVPEGALGKTQSIAKIVKHLPYTEKSSVRFGLP